MLLHLVTALADLPLLVLATGGHELGWFGANQWVDDAPDPAIAVVHVGASAAVLDPGCGPDRPLARTRVALTSLTAAAASPIETALAPTRMMFRSGADSWLGEGQAFCRLGVPLLSMSGAGRDFHCPEDTPDRATSPAALATVADAVAAAARSLYSTASRGRSWPRTRNSPRSRISGCVCCPGPIGPWDQTSSIRTIGALSP